MTKHFPRQHIAQQLSDLRQMRAALSDMISSACGLLAHSSAAGVPDELRLEFVLALSAAERADKATQEVIKRLYDMPIPKAANDHEEAA